MTALMIMWTMSSFGIILITIYVLTGFSRSYLLYLGAGFLISAVVLCTPHPIRGVVQALAGAVFIYALLESVMDTRARLRNLRNEQRAREAAYADYLRKLARNGMREGQDKWAPR